jgi:hypothetical protein
MNPSEIGTRHRPTRTAVLAFVFPSANEGLTCTQSRSTSQCIMKHTVEIRSLAPKDLKIT